jgi:hypothetical protein
MPGESPQIDTGLPTPGHNELSALEEIADRQARALGRASPFYWRQASMRKLDVHGFVQRHPGYGSENNPAWQITEARRQKLRSIQRAD